MAKDIFPCAGCSTPTEIDLLDAKPNGDPDDMDAWRDVKLLCQECYGEGWAPARVPA